MIECIAILNLLTFADDIHRQERTETCEELVLEARVAKVPPALILSIAWVESNWMMHKEPSKSNTVGPMQIKVNYWCPPAKGAWKSTQTNGVLKGCNIVKRGVFAYTWYIDRFQTINKALACFGGDCADTKYPAKVMKKFKLMARHFR